MKPLCLVLLALGIPIGLMLIFSTRDTSDRAASPAPSRPAHPTPAVATTRPARARAPLPVASRPSLVQTLRLADELLSSALERTGRSDTDLDRAGQYLADHDFPHALIAFDRLLVHDPNDPALLLGKGMALSGLSRHEDALPLFERAIERDANNAAARFNYAVTLTHVGQVDAAAAALKELLVRHPEHARARFNLATLLQARQHYAEALSQWRELTDNAPAPTTQPNAHAVLLMRIHLVQAWSHRGECAFSLGRNSEAEMSFQKVVDLDPDARAWADLGITQAARSRNHQAMSSLEKALQLDPKLVPALNQLAYLNATMYHQTGDLDARAKVLELSQRSLSLEPAQDNMRQLRFALEHENDEPDETPPEEADDEMRRSTATRPE